MSTFLELRGIAKSFRPGILKRIQIIPDLSCSFLDQKCTAYLGHNGAGKTTTIRLILGLATPDKGTILCRGKAMTRLDRADIGYMPEVSKLPMDLTCEEVLRHQLHLYRPGGHGASHARLIDERLEEAGLAAHRKKRVGKLSKGMGRRLAWAQATIHDPRFLILDEPFSGLDPLGRLEMQGWMKTLKGRGVGMMMCTHEFWSVRELCDEVYVLNKGRLVYSSATDQGSDSRSGYSLHVEGRTEGEVASLGVASRLTPWLSCRSITGGLVLYFGDNGVASAWLATLVQAGVSITHFGRESRWNENEMMRYFA